MLELYKVENGTRILKSKIVKIPVCYDDGFAVDLGPYSEDVKLLKPERIKLHYQTIYTVFLIGFLYLGGSNLALFLY